MNMDYIFAAKVIADLLQDDDTAYEAYPDAAFDFGKRAITALQDAGFHLTHLAADIPPVAQSTTPPTSPSDSSLQVALTPTDTASGR